MAVALIAFSMFRYVGDPVANMVGPETTREEIRELRERLGLADPLPVQFARFVTNAVQGEFGISYRQGRRVSTLIAERLPATLELALLSALFASVFGTILGIYTAIRRDGWLSHVIMTVSLIGVSLPTFLIGIGLIYLFAVELRWLPSFGRGEVVKFGWWTTGLLTESGRKSLVLPVLTLGFFQLTLIMRLVRAQMLETFRTDYVKFSRARGFAGVAHQLQACSGQCDDPCRHHHRAYGRIFVAVEPIKLTQTHFSRRSFRPLSQAPITGQSRE